MRSTSVAIMPPKKVPKLLPGQRRINFCGKGEDNEEEPVRKEATEREGGDTVTVTVAEAKVSEEPKTKPKRSTIEGWLATYKWLICEPDKPMFCSVCLIGGEKNAFTSAQNLILTPLRNRLTGQNQDMLLRVKLHFKEIDPFEAYKKWKEAKNRKV